MMFRSRKRATGKTAWARVPEGDVAALADALSGVVRNAETLGIDPSRIRMAPIRKAKTFDGEPLWALSFSVSDEDWELRGYPTDQVSETELREMTPQQVTAALKAGRLKGLML